MRDVVFLVAPHTPQTEGMIPGPSSLRCLMERCWSTSPAASWSTPTHCSPKPRLAAFARHST